MQNNTRVANLRRNVLLKNYDVTPLNAAHFRVTDGWLIGPENQRFCTIQALLDQGLRNVFVLGHSGGLLYNDRVICPDINLLRKFDGTPALGRIVCSRSNIGGFRVVADCLVSPNGENLGDIREMYVERPGGDVMIHELL